MHMIRLGDELLASVIPDQITAEISKVFDYDFHGVSQFTVPKFEKPAKDFAIGLIVGPSGSGKTTLLSAFGKQQTIEWNNQQAICSHFNNATEASEKLSAVGLNSIPSWLKPYDCLSTGEKFRADLARIVSENCIIDEFTSVVDRNVAASCSMALNRYVNKNNIKNIVLASCHYDIIKWLQPDWVFDTKTGLMTSGRLVQRSKIELEIFPCRSEMWSIFRQHHYLTASLNKSARCWVAVWKDEPIGFMSAIAFPNGNFSNAWREHRTVVLPDFQGMGLGVRLSDWVGEQFRKQGSRYFSKTSHPRMGEYRERSPLWVATSKNKKQRLDYNPDHKTKEDSHKMRHAARLCYSHEYVGC